MELMTPVEFAKSIGVAPQIIYSYIKRGLPTHKAEHKGKERDMVEPAEAQTWIDGYSQTKGTRRTHSEKIRDDKAIAEGRMPAQQTRSRNELPVGSLIAYERLPGHATVAKVVSKNEYFANVEKACYELPFILQKTIKRTSPLTHDTLRKAIMARDVILDTPIQIMDYCIEQIQHASPEFAEDLRQVVCKHVNAYIQANIPKPDFEQVERVIEPVDVAIKEDM